MTNISQRYHSARLISIGLLRVLELKKARALFLSSKLLEISYFLIYMLILCLFNSKFRQHYNTSGNSLPYFHCTCAETAICAVCTSYLNSDTTNEFSDPDFRQDMAISVIGGHLPFTLSSSHLVPVSIRVLEYSIRY